MIDWNILGIDPTDNIKEIKKAYASKAKEYHPEECPEEFERLHSSYKEALAFAKSAGKSSVSGKNAPLESLVTEEENEVSENEHSFDFSQIKVSDEQSADYAEAKKDDEVSFDFKDEMDNYHREHDGAVIEKTQKIIESADKIICDNSGVDKYDLWKSLFDTEDFKAVKNEKIFVDIFSQSLINRRLGFDSIKAIDEEFSLERLSGEIDRGVYDPLCDVMFEHRSRIQKIKNDRKRKITQAILSIAAAAVFVLKILHRSGLF